MDKLPPLRQELALQPGPAADDGSPTWTLHDPAANRFYQLGWAAFEILSRWSLGNEAAVLAAVRAETTLQVDAQDIAGVASFLQHHHLLLATGAADTARLAAHAGAGRPGLWHWLLHHYLFFRIPLFRPMPLLARTAGWVGFVFNPRFWWAMAAVAVAGLYLVSQRWDSFVHSFTAYGNWQGWLGIAVALSLAKVLHEFGHAHAAYRHGCRVPAMGVAFLVMWPVLYTDTNEAWKLGSRRARLQIGAAGMAAELALAACATLLWSFLPDGPLRAGVFMLATSTWLVTLAINLSPFMRFDGYFLLSDLLNMPNLHERAFAFGRWRLRELLFGLGLPAPEAVAPGRRRFLVLFAWGTWAYRFVLFIGIALLVYHLFFKLLGVLLLAVELGWFLVLPMWRELRAWWQLRAGLGWNAACRRTAVLAAAALLLMLLPIWGGVRAPAMLLAERSQHVYAPAAAQVQAVHVKAGEAVRAGQLLLVLASPDLQAQLARDEARERKLRWQLGQQDFDPRLQAAGGALTSRWEAAREALAGTRSLVEQLQIRAAFDGRIASDNPALQRGGWIPKGEPLLQIASPEGVRVEAFVDEQALARLSGQAGGGSFIADQPGLPRVSCQRLAADKLNVPTLKFAALASVNGGAIAAARSAREPAVLQPLQSLFRVRLDDCTGPAGTLRELSGSATLDARRESLFGRWARAALVLWRQEGGL
ncbi:efflux RND transporter periplasmic adaptor subunit [Roseateles sp. P5_E7]